MQLVIYIHLLFSAKFYKSKISAFHTPLFYCWRLSCRSKSSNFTWSLRSRVSTDLKASLSSLFMVSMSGSSTKNVAHNWQNSANSISPEPSSSISRRRSLSSSSVGLKTRNWSHLALGLYFFTLPESHGSHDLTKVISRKELNLLGVEQIKTGLKQKLLVKIKMSPWNN